MLDKEYLKDDGSLDIARINSLPLFEHMHVISSMTQKQYKQYWCEYVSHLPVGNGPVQPVKVDHRIAEAVRRGIEYDPKQVKLIDGIWCLGDSIACYFTFLYSSAQYSSFFLVLCLCHFNKEIRRSLNVLCRLQIEWKELEFLGNKDLKYFVY